MTVITLAIMVNIACAFLAARIAPRTDLSPTVGFLVGLGAGPIGLALVWWDDAPRV